MADDNGSVLDRVLGGDDAEDPEAPGTGGLTPEPEGERDQSWTPDEEGFGDDGRPDSPGLDAEQGGEDDKPPAEPDAGEEEAKVDWNELLAGIEGKPENWEALLKTESKRRADTQRSWQEKEAELKRERALREQSEELLKALKSQAGEDVTGTDQMTDGDVAEELQRRLTEDPEAALTWQAKRFQSEIDAVKKAQAEQLMAIREDASRQRHEDYDDMVTDFLVPEMQADDSLVAEFHKRGGTPEAAYKMAKERKAYRAFSEDPEAFRASIREEVLKEMREKGRNAPAPDSQTLAGLPSAPPKKTRGGNRRSSSVLSEMFGD